MGLYEICLGSFDGKFYKCIVQLREKYSFSEVLNLLSFGFNKCHFKPALQTVRMENKTQELFELSDKNVIH